MSVANDREEPEASLLVEVNLPQAAEKKQARRFVVVLLTIVTSAITCLFFVLTCLVASEMATTYGLRSTILNLVMSLLLFVDIVCVTLTLTYVSYKCRKVLRDC